MDGHETTPVMKDAAIGRRTATVLSVVFVVFLAVPAAHQALVDLRAAGRWKFLALFRQTPTHQSLKEFEETLARESDLGATARVAYQTALARTLGQGNEKIVLGRDGFLFYRKEVDMVTGPGFLSPRRQKKRGIAGDGDPERASDPLAAVVDTHRQLEARGIHFVFIPLPVKSFVYPERLWSGYPVASGPAWNRDRLEFESRLVKAGVDVLDLTDDLWKAKAQGEVFLRLDTHWTPLGLGVAADRIASRARPWAPSPRAAFESSHASVTHDGDLLRMIEVFRVGRLFEPQSVEIVQCPVRGDDTAAILLLGDSFSNIYSRKELEWGEHAGLGEQLALRLGVPVQVLALNGGGATSVRELLARKPGALKRKKLVLWACSARDLFDEAVSWDKVPLPEVAP